MPIGINKKKEMLFIKVSPDNLKNDLKKTDLLHELKVTAIQYIEAYNSSLSLGNF